MIIYKTTNLINNKIYVGQDKNNCPIYLGSGKVLKQAIKKYGIENFKKEILEFCESKEQLNEREIFWIKKLHAGKRGVGYNIAKGGVGGDVFSNKTKKEKEITRKRISITSTKNQADPNYRKRMSEILKNKYKEDPLFKTRVSDGIKLAYKNNPKLSKKLSTAMKKVKHTKEWNQKVGFNNKVRYHAKKINYAIRKKVPKEIIAKYFNVPLSKIENLKEFSKEPHIEILLESYNLHKNGRSYNYIIRNLKDAPSYGQFCTFKHFLDTLQDKVMCGDCK